MDITAFLTAQRNEALLVGDYNTYWAQGTRRLHTLRKRLGQTTPRGRKYTSKAEVTAQDIGRNRDYVHLLLVGAERAWANAMAMKSAQSPETTQKAMPASTKRQILSRLTKATVYARHLTQLLQDQTTTHASAVDLMEAQAYLSSLKGALYFEKARWQLSIELYSVARLVYTTLRSTSRTDVFSDIVSATVDPSIRYAAYQLKMPRTKPVPDIAVEYFPQNEKELRSGIEKMNPDAFESRKASTSESENAVNDLPSTITWRGRTVNIEDATIAQTLGTAISKETDVFSTFENFQDESISTKELAAGYDDVINARQDVVDATKTAIDELSAEGIDPSDKRMQSLQITRTAVNYAVIEWRVGRNRLLCGPRDGLHFDPEQSRAAKRSEKDGKARRVKDESTGRKLARLRERVALYDAILQDVEAVKALPGVAADSTFLAELASRRAYFRALKCLAVGRSYAAREQLVNALALFARAADLSRSVPSPTTASTEHSGSPARLDVSTDRIEELRHYAQSIVSQYRARVELQRLQEQDTKPTRHAFDPPLIDTLDQYPAGEVDLTNLVTYPPKIQPIPVKPVFLDLAWNYIDYPHRVPSAAAAVNGTAPGTKEGTTAIGPAEEKKNRGWFGFGRG